VEAVALAIAKSSSTISAAVKFPQNAGKPENPAEDRPLAAIPCAVQLQFALRLSGGNFDEVGHRASPHTPLGRERASLLRGAVSLSRQRPMIVADDAVC
jgi:hypothetical protein